MKRKTIAVIAFAILTAGTVSAAFASDLSSKFPIITPFSDNLLVNETGKEASVRDVVELETQAYGPVKIRKIEITSDTASADGARYTVTLSLTWDAADSLKVIRENADRLCDAIAGHLAEDAFLTGLVCKWNAPQTLCASVAGKKEYGFENGEAYPKGASGAMYRQ